MFVVAQLPARLRRPALVAGLLALAALAGCGGEEAKTGPVDSLCSDGEQKCYQNALLTCETDGKAWKVAMCGESKSCGTGDSGVGCQSLVCARGSLSCDDKKVLKCPDDGLSEPTPVQSCKTTEHCVYGACVPTACTDGDKRCGWNAALVCNGGAWTSQKCAADERCDAGTCVKRACTPTEIACVSETRRKTCAIDGSAWTETACASGEVCSDGVCHAKVKGTEPVADTTGGGSDAGGTDGGGGFLDVQKDEFVFEPLDVLTVKIGPTDPPSAETVEFEFVAGGWLTNEQMIQVSGDKNLHKVEIVIAPVEEYTTGDFSALGGEAPNSGVFMNDGTHDQSTVQWRYQSLDYTVSISEFGDIGGRIKGTFWAELGDAIEQGKKLYIEGSFDVKRTQ